MRDREREGEGRKKKNTSILIGMDDTPRLLFLEFPLFASESQGDQSRAMIRYHRPNSSFDHVGLLIRYHGQILDHARADEPIRPPLLTPVD